MSNKSRKRSSTTATVIVDESDIVDAKKLKESEETTVTISELEFKFLLRDPKTVSEGLAKFTSTAEAYNDGIPCQDIVAGYCRSSPSCAELWSLIDPTNTTLKINDIGFVFQCLEHILTRIRNDLFKFSSTGEAIVQKILAVHMGQLYSCLRDQNKSKTIKAALKLLISMVLLSDKSKKAVLTRLNFGHQNFPSLFRRRNRKDPQDVRSCAVLLTLAFLLDGDNTVIKTLVQQKTFLQMTIAGLKYDSKEVVVDTLATLMDKVVKCPAVTKTDKIKLFSEVTLRQFCDLYQWLGPSGWTTGVKKRQDKDEDGLDTSSLKTSEDKEVVATVVHDFLTELCCSHKYGLNFFDKTMGTGTRNQNQLLSHFLEFLVKKMDDVHVCDLIVSILCACPDQIKSVLNTLSPSLAPRWSEKWGSLMDWLAKLYSSLAESVQVNTSGDVHSVVSMATVLCLPPPKVAAIIIQSLKHEDVQVRHKSLQLVRVLATKAYSIHQQLATLSLKTSSTEESLLEAFSTNVLKTLPSVAQVFMCVDKITQKLLQRQKKQKEQDVDLSSHAVTILQVLSLYQSLSPNLVSDKPKELAKLIEMVGHLQQITESTDDEMEVDTEVKDSDEGDEQADEDTRWLPQLYLLKLLSETDARKISLGREGLLEKLLTSASQSGYSKDLIISLICKMLQSVEVFYGHGKELSIWLEAALGQGSKVKGSQSTDSALFLARCLATLINNPTPYVDRMMEMLGGLEVDGETDVEITVGSKKKAIDAILQMEDEKLDEMFEKSAPPLPSEEQKGLNLPLSPLTLVVLDSLDNSNKGDGNQLVYISRALVGLVHSLGDPVSLARVVQHSKASLPQDVRRYIQFWLSKKPPRTVKLDPLQPGIFGSFTSTLTAVLFCKSDQELGDTTLTQLTSDITEMTARDRIGGLDQLALYLGETARWAAKDLQYKQILKELMKVAEILIDHIGKDEKWNGPEPNKVQNPSTPGKEKNQDAQINTADTKVGLAAGSIFSDLFSSVGSCGVSAADAIKGLFDNQGLNEQLFNETALQTTKRKSPKKKDTAECKVPCIVSTFMCSVLKKCKNFLWFVRETNTAERYLSCVMSRLLSQGHELAPKLYGSYVALIKNLYTLFDLVGLSRCLAQLLQLPASSFIDTPSDGDDDDVQEKPLGKILCKILDRWVQLVKDDPVFINQSHGQLWTKEGPNNFFSQTPGTCPHDSGGVSTKGRIYLKTSFSLKSSTHQTATSYAPVFELLPLYQSENLHRFVIFAMRHLPEMVNVFRIEWFAPIFLSPLKLEAGSLEEEVVMVLIERVRACFLQCDQWLLDHGGKAFKKGKWALIKCYLKARNTFLDGCTATVETLKNAAVAQLTTKSPQSFDDELLEVYELLALAVSDKDEKFQKLLTETMKTAIANPSTPKMIQHFKVFKVSAKFSHRHPTKSGSEVKAMTHTSLLDLALTHLTYLTSSKSNRHAEMESYLLDLFPELLTEENERNFEFLVPYWGKLVMNSLRHLFTNAKLLKLLSYLVPLVYGLDSAHKTAAGPPTASSPYVSAQTMFQMCVSHTAFLGVMMSQENLVAKEELVNLLFGLGDLDPSVYKPQMSKVFVGAYGATLSKTDQRLLIMIEKCCQDSGKKFECPTLWGKSALEHDTVSQVLGPSLDKEASVKSVLEQIDAACLQDSILNFPVRRALLPTQVLDASDFKSKPECYDPNFLLRLFVQILSPDKLVPLRMFVERGCLSYLLVALSCHDATNRLLAYQALNDFYLHADGSRFQERVEVNFLLDLLNASRVKDGQKLSFVVALFFARVVKLFMYPADPLYMPIFRFLVAKPEMDLSNVPEFYKLFYSSGVQYKQERNWVLSLLCDGMRETADYWLYQKKLIFKILMCFHDSVLSDVHSQGLILSALRNACREKFVAVDLVKNHGLMSWLLGVVKNLENRPQHTDLVCDIVHTLWVSLTSSKYIDSQANQSSLSSNQGSSELSVNEAKAVETKAPRKDNKKKADKAATQVEKKKEEGSSEEEVESSDEEEESSDDEGVSSGEEESNEGTEEEEMPGREDPQTEEKKEDRVEDVRDTSVHQRSSPRAITVPKSTQVEMGFIVKNLIVHLSNISTVESLTKTLEVIHSMVSRPGDPDSQDGVLNTSHRSTDQEHSFSSPHKGVNTDALRLLNISPNETCLLLYHTAKKLQDEMTARAAEDALKSRGAVLGLVARQPSRKPSKPGSRPQKLEKGELTADVAEVDDKDEEEALNRTVNVESSLTSNVGSKETVRDEEKQKLLNLISSVAILTGTLLMV